MEERGRGKFYVTAGVAVGAIPAAQYDEAGQYIPLDWETMDGEGLRCDNPEEMQLPEIVCISRMAEAYDKGILPTRGALLDQPAKAMSGMRLWNRMIEKNQEIKRKRETHREE